MYNKYNNKERQDIMYPSEDIYWEGGADDERAAAERADITQDEDIVLLAGDDDPAWLDEPDYDEETDA